MNNNEYIKSSLELHLFFDRIMKEHSLFLETAFMEKNKNLKEVAREFQKRFTDILNQTLILADSNISTNFLKSNEMVTPNTFNAENQTSILAGVPIDMDITKKELALKDGQINVSNDLIQAVSQLNKETLPLIKNLINFKTDILNNVLSCKIYTTNYPLLITHIMNEAKMYYNLLTKIENRTMLTQKEIHEQELFWNIIMKEHAEFIRGLLDPTEEKLMLTADQYAKEYKILINKYSNNQTYLTNTSLNETLKFRDFKIAGEEGILNCKIKSIIMPLLADHIVREANHFIRILENLKM